MRPIVHIGYHKTATTWFQRDVYPHALNRRYVARGDVQAALLAPSALAFDPAAARAALPPEPGLILCEENLSGYPHNAGLHGFLSAGLAERVRAVLPDATVVMVVRRQPAMVGACYLQYLRGGGTHGVHRYLFPEDHLFGAASEPWKAPRFGWDHLDYHRLAARYAELFGRERVRVYPYEALATDRDAFLRRFAADLRLELDWDRVGHARRNRSYNRPAALLARALNRFTARSVIDKRTLLHVPGLYTARRPLLEGVSRLARRPTPAALLGRRTVAWIEQRYWESNARLAADWDLDLAVHGYPMAPPPEPVERPRAATWRKFLAR